MNEIGLVVLEKNASKTWFRVRKLEYREISLGH